MTLCVLDASVALGWSFEDEVSTYAEYVIGSLVEMRAAVPLIWPLEVNNAMVAAIRRGRIEQQDADRLLDVLDRLPIDIDAEIAVGALGHRILSLALEYHLSSYDASYLELAIRRGLPLATEDDRLARAAESARVELFHHHRRGNSANA